MGLWSWFKSLTITKLLMGYIFLASGFLVSFLMLCGMVIWPFNKNLYRKLCHVLTYALWSQFSFMGNWWSQSECDLYIDPEDRKFLGHEHAVTMSNHTYEMDWLMAWMMSERHGMLGSTKVYGKEILKFVPVLGWTWYFTESIFLKRNWNADKKILEKSIGAIVTYPPGVWVNLLLFPEGTRWTPVKHEICQKIAKEKGYPQYKHMLLPRTKGFFLSMQLMKGKIPAVYDLTVGFPTNEPEPSFLDIISGKKARCALKVKRYLIADIPSETEEECGDWLRNLYKQKDEDLIYYKRTGRFEGLPKVHAAKRHYDLIYYIFWTILTCIPLGYYLKFAIFSASFIHQLLLGLSIVSLILMSKWMIRFTEVKHGTSYGLETSDGQQKKSQ